MNLHRRRLAQAAVFFLMQGWLAHLANGSDAVFRRVTIAKVAGTSKQGELLVAPSKLLQVFGQPTAESWDSESLGAFYFQGPNDEVFTVYYRAYDVPNTQRLKKEFWARSAAAAFSIGAKEEANVAEFKGWLLRQLA
ncbi:hypothetical protein [Methylibium rhizosphaerae]|uniref:hypothetical protein n=1 Tax=Methylibium rhizosphaerae TaxID=2570323 RepID=UPI00112DBF2C|nr:hypothetical protein [Methylibium rhizosphaerae]